MDAKSRRTKGQSNRLWLMVAVLSVFLVVAGCASPSGTTANPPTNATNPPAAADTMVASTQAGTAAGSSEACTLLSAADVAKVLGSSVDSTQASGLGGSCNYVSGNTSIDFTFSQTGGKKAMETTQANLGDMALNVPGLGDMAFYNTNAASALFVLKGDAEYLFSMSDTTYQPMDDAFVQSTEKALAEQLLSKLP